VTELWRPATPKIEKTATKRAGGDNTAHSSENEHSFFLNRRHVISEKAGNKKARF
jgi:hypothetical protein